MLILSLIASFVTACIGTIISFFVLESMHHKYFVTKLVWLSAALFGACVFAWFFPLAALLLIEGGFAFFFLIAIGDKYGWKWVEKLPL